jgi:hypothetical protein
MTIDPEGSPNPVIEMFASGGTRGFMSRETAKGIYRELLRLEHQ